MSTILLSDRNHEVYSVDYIDILKSTCEASFWEFCREFWEDIPGAGIMIENWHMPYICNELQIAAERVFRNEPKEYDIVINISPGTSKSSICSILFQPWTWTRMPHARHLCATHTDDLVLDFGAKARTVIESEKYKLAWPEIELRHDQDTKGYFANTLGGDRKSCTVGGKSPTGFHAHFIGIDDPIDPKKMISEVEAKAAKEFITNIITSRKVNKAVSLTSLIMQRLGRNDPTAVKLDLATKEDGGRVRHICLPAELSDKVKPIELREKYIDGLMDPVRLSRSVLKEFRVSMGRYAFAGQFEQYPIPMEGGMFRESYFNQRVKAAPYTAKRIRFWDRAATAEGGCATAGVLISKDNIGNYFVEDCVLGHWEPDERNRMMKSTALKDRTRYGPKYAPLIYVEREGGSSGRDAWKAVAKALEGFAVYEQTVTGSKDTRAEPWACQLAAGNVYIVEDELNSWDINGYIQEHCLFRPEPNVKLGRDKDRVDSSSGGFNLLAGVKQGSVMRTLTFGGKANTQLRIVVCNSENLQTTIIDQPTILISLQLPEPQNDGQVPVTAVSKLLESIVIQCIDLDPKEAQENWGEIDPLYNKPQSELILQANQGKLIWRTILKQRSEAARVFVICCDDRRGPAAACAIADCLHLPRSAVYEMSNPEKSHDSVPENVHFFEMLKSSRHLVM